MTGLSRTLQSAHPLLEGALAAAGLSPTPFAAGEGARPSVPSLLALSETEFARADDVIVDADAARPSLHRPEGEPARLSFGHADLPMGLAIAAELVRPAVRPAAADPASLATLAFAHRIAASDASVLILGETGTGKEGLARYVHAMSPRARGPFVAVNCAALPETMLEAILFGHRRGAFTGAAGDGEGLFRAAANGTLLLDEIAEVPLALQAKLLRALQEKEVLPVGATRSEKVDVRVVACANRDLAEEVAAGRFRADLYWRLNVVPLRLTALRDRREDIPAIAAALLLRHVDSMSHFPFPTAEALVNLMAHDWPGNVRELENVLMRALLLRRGERIELDDLVIDRLPGRAPEQIAAARPDFESMADAARAAEASSIRAALAETGGHRVRAAEKLGISERTLRYRLAEMRAAAA